MIWNRLRRKKQVIAAVLMIAALSLCGCAGGAQDPDDGEDAQETSGESEPEEGQTTDDTKKEPEQEDEGVSEITTGYDPLWADTDREMRNGKKRKSNIVLAEGIAKIDWVELTEEMEDTAIAYRGNEARLQELMQRAKDGDEITLAYIGGSITRGANATSSGRCYAALTTQWWEESFPDADITYVNAGIGETDSYIGVHRVAKDVLSHSPDLVVVEFSVNDTEEINKETYESLLRRLLEDENEPAVVCLMMGTKDRSFSYEHFPIVMHYDLPIINFNALLDGGMINWDEVGCPDGIHPSDAGHRLIADLVVEFYEDVLDDVNDGDHAEAYELPESPISACSYMDAEFIFADDEEDVEITGMEGDGDTETTLGGEGWVADTEETIRIEMEARTFGIVYMELKEEPEDGCESYEVYVDGEYLDTINGYEDGNGRDSLAYIECLKEDSAAYHVVELVPQGEGDFFEIPALAVGE